MSSLHRLMAAAGLAATSSLIAPPTGFAQLTKASHRNDGDALCPDGLPCSRARAAAPWFNPWVDEDPVGRCMACDASELTDLLHCNLDIEVNPTAQTISGSNTFTIMSKMDGLSTFTFRLRNQFVISSAVVNGTTPVVVSTPTTTTRIATLDRQYNNGEVFTLTITYSGVPVSVGGFGSIEFTTQNGLPLVQTLSEPYYSYTWWPCKDGDQGALGDNSDKFTAEVAITAPDTLTSISNGLLQGVDVLPNSRKRFRWATNYQTATYLICFCTTVYNQWEQTYSYPLPGGGTGMMPVQFSIYPANDTASHRTSWQKCVQMLATYRNFYGEYPFVNEKYGIYNFNFSGGQEHQTYTGEGTFSESVTSHELGHQWWGDNVTCKTWSDIWLNEGFATYTEALWIQYRPGSAGWPDYYSAMNARRPSAVSQSVYRTDLSNVNSIFSTAYSYDKPAWVLHALRHVIGDTAFFNTLATYRQMFQGSAATTDDFAAVASMVSGQDLTWFFQEWIYGPGAPAYASGWQAVNINGQNYLRLRVRQSQNAYPTFIMPIDVQVSTASGNETHTVWNNNTTQWYLIPIAAPATGMALDPNAWILSTANTTEAYVNGPPKIVSSSVLPGASIAAASSPSQISIGFSDNVNAPAAAFSLVGPSGLVPVQVTYDAPTFTATLDAGAALPPGQYTLTVRDTVTSVASSLGLDGEITGTGAAAFPSGNGLTNGNAVWMFTVQAAPCYANCDGSTSTPVLNVNDFVCFQNRFAAGDSYANCDGSTTPPVLNVNDFVCFQGQFAAGCP